MSDLLDLYQEIIVDHAQSPRNTGTLTGDGVRLEAAYNPLCGDRVTVYTDIDAEGIVQDISFEGEGCAISQASASLMTEHMKGLTVAQAIERFETFRLLLTEEDAVDEESLEQLGSIAALEGVRDYPMRVKCATLAWHALRTLLAGDQEPVEPSGASEL